MNIIRCSSLIFCSIATVLIFSQPEIVKDTRPISSLSFFDKGIMNDPIMTLDFGSHRASLDQHIYQVREGSIGGYDAVGGNCGCN
jgi:hypothetical protein